MQDLTQDYLLSVFEYKDGELFWKVDRRKTKIGQKAGRRKPNGYCEVRLDGKLHGTHRLIYMMINGTMPKIVDHIDGNPSNNRIENLRCATHAENTWNSKRAKNNSSGFKGVQKHKDKWVAIVIFHGKRHRLGVFKDAIEAAKAVSLARIELHGEFANHGKHKASKVDFLTSTQE